MGDRYAVAFSGVFGSGYLEDETRSKLEIFSAGSKEEIEWKAERIFLSDFNILSFSVVIIDNGRKNQRLSSLITDFLNNNVLVLNPPWRKRNKYLRKSPNKTS
jgi:hypothetical protein